MWSFFGLCSSEDDVGGAEFSESGSGVLQEILLLSICAETKGEDYLKRFSCVTDDGAGGSEGVYGGTRSHQESGRGHIACPLFLRDVVFSVITQWGLTAMLMCRVQ